MPTKRDWEELREEVKKRLDPAEAFASVQKAKVEASGKGTGLCPFHEDRNPSLSFHTKEGVYNCFSAACGAHGDHVGFLLDQEGGDFKTAISRLAGRLGISIPGRRKEKKRKREVANDVVYVYRDEKGEPVLEVVRLNFTDGTKTFFQRLPGADKKGLKPDTRRVLYQLPGLIEADAARWIFLVEGEKCVEALRDRGFLATTSPGGSSSWGRVDEESVKVFTGRRVIILPDNDTSGRKYAEAACESIIPLAEELRVVELPGLPQRGDVSDWFEDGGTPEKLREFCRDAETRKKPPSLLGVRNFREDPIVQDDGTIKECNVAVELDEVLETLETVVGRWPKRLDNQLFVEREDGGIQFLNEHADLTSWVQSRSKNFGWVDSGQDVTGKSFVKRGEVFSQLSASAPEVDEIFAAPIYPERERVHVRRSARVAADTDGSVFRELLARFCPETEGDAALLQAFALTPHWGGEPGSRPLFIITGSGDASAPQVGKTTLVEVLSEISGGAVRLDLEEAKRRTGLPEQLVSDQALRRRVALLDNVSGVVNMAKLAELVTTTEFWGRPTYGKMRRRSNFLTWCMTSVIPSVDEDLATRSFVIHLDMPAELREEWRHETEDFIQRNRERLWSDAVSLLAGHKWGILGTRSRFPDWEKCVLATHPAASEALSDRVRRLHRVSADEDGLVLFFQELYERYKNQLEVELKTSELTEIWNEATGLAAKPVGFGRQLKSFAARNKLPEGMFRKWAKRRESPWIVQTNRLFPEEAEADSDAPF